MEAKHTPGPWCFGEFELYPGAGLRFNISQAEGAAHTPHYSDVAQTITGEDLSIQEANARLIAAAPELLKALQELQGIVQGAIDDGLPLGRHIDSFTLQAARAAIAKATS